MPIYKVQKYDNPFVQIDKRILEDARLSWKAKGLLAYLLSKPHDWQVRTADIVKKATDGKTAVLTAITELINTGYATREQSHTEAGQWAETVYVITEVPQSGFPYTVKPYTDNPLHSNNDSSNNKACASKPTRAPRKPTPPAVLVFKANAHRYPTKSWCKKVDSTIGDDPAALKKWGEIVRDWVGNGWNPMNVKGMLEVYQSGWKVHQPGNRRPEPKPTTVDRVF